MKYEEGADLCYLDIVNNIVKDRGHPTVNIRMETCAKGRDIDNSADDWEKIRDNQYELSN